MQRPGVLVYLQNSKPDSEAGLGSCLHHESGRLTIDSCILQCWANPLYLSLISTGGGNEGAVFVGETNGDRVLLFPKLGLKEVPKLS